MATRKVKMLVSMAGPAISLSPGDEHECSADEAERFIAAGIAEPIEAESLVEEAKSTGKKLVEKAKKLIAGKETRG